MNIVRNDKVVLVKEFGELKTIGESYEVANITETAIVLRNSVTKIAVCAIDINNFDEYFIKQENAKGWTSWQRLVDEANNTVAFYRTNYKKVQVKTNNYRAEATCNKGDNFNLYFGIQLAYARCMNKFFIDVKNNHEEGLKKATSNMLATQNIMKKMINSLDKETK